MGLEIIVLLLSAAVVAGLLAGLLGIGGGLIIIPLLHFIFHYMKIPLDVLVLMASATSLFIVIFTSIVNIVNHYKNGNIDKNVIRMVSPYLITGSLLGVGLATHLHGNFLYYFFHTSLFFIAMNMLFGRKTALLKGEPNHLLIRFSGIFIGFFSSILGIGAASLGVPTYTLLNFPIRKAIGNITVMSFMIAFPSTLFFMFDGLQFNTGIPYTLGYIHIMVALIMIPVSMFCVPLGVKIGLKMDQKTLKRVFAVFILIVSLKPFYLQ